MANYKLSVDRIEDNKAVLITQEGKQIIIDKDMIDFEIKEGEVIYLDITKDLKETQIKEQQAKDLLNQILTKNNESGE
jgi:DUF3006 family protein